MGGDAVGAGASWFPSRWGRVVFGVGWASLRWRTRVTFRNIWRTSVNIWLAPGSPSGVAETCRHASAQRNTVSQRRKPLRWKPSLPSRKHPFWQAPQPCGEGWQVHSTLRRQCGVIAQSLALGPTESVIRLTRARCPELRQGVAALEC